MIAAKTAPSLLALMGSLDWLTTIVGIAYFGALEANPFVATFANANWLAFTGMKLGAAFLVAFLFYQAEIALGEKQNCKKMGFKGRRCLLRGAQAISLCVLLVAVLNNLTVIAATRGWS